MTDQEPRPIEELKAEWAALSDAEQGREMDTYHFMVIDSHSDAADHPYYQLLK